MSLHNAHSRRSFLRRGLLAGVSAVGLAAVAACGGTAGSVPGAGAAPPTCLAHDLAPGEPVLLLIGSPMGATGFVTLSSHFTDRTVVTYDPRGSERSVKADPESPSTPEEHADDLHRLIQSLDTGPVDLFATSGGAVNALALVARHPAQVRTLVAHEPPLLGLLPDRDVALAAARDIHETYMRSGLGPGMAKFFTLIQLRGPIPASQSRGVRRCRAPGKEPCHLSG